jgi:hypothetical protein
MAKRILTFLAVSLALFITPSSATVCGDATTCVNSFSSGNTTGIYDFTGGGNGYLVVQFDKVLTSFTLTVMLTDVTDLSVTDEFPEGTVCVAYAPNFGHCVQYNFSAAALPNGIPVKDVDYKGLITLNLSYLTTQTIREPAFGHAPGETATFTEDILTSYSSEPVCTDVTCPSDPTMSGKTPGLSSVAALDKPLPPGGTTTVCGLVAIQQGSSQNPLVEVSFKLVSGTVTQDVCLQGTPIKDKTAGLSVSTTDSSGNFSSFPPLINGGDANKFHWDGRTGLNVQDVNTVGLPGGTYTVTVISTKFSPVSTTFIVH